MGAELPQIRDHVSLKALNTFGVDVRARHLARIGSAEQLGALLSRHQLPAGERLVLGGGSNVLFRSDFPGLVLHMAITGRSVTGEDEHRVRVTAGAGENWHALVCWTLRQGLGGLENLSLIPGSVGAAPIQNIGAYGVELSDRFHSLTAVDTTNLTVVEMDASDCAFAYRDSRFRREPGRWIITRLTLSLARQWTPVLDYRGLAEEVGMAQPDALAVSEAVCRMRRRKLPDPEQIGNAGSFFKNPVVDAATWERLRKLEPRLVAFPSPGDSVKLAAASLIEQCGWKGFRDGDTGVSEKHALILVNHGTAGGEQIWALARQIRESVKSRFGVVLEPEPLIV